MGLLEASKLACKEALGKEAWRDLELPQIGCVGFSTAGEKHPKLSGVWQILESVGQREQLQHSPGLHTLENVVRQHF